MIVYRNSIYCTHHIFIPTHANSLQNFLLILFIFLYSKLGAGTSLPGVVAALCGANVTLTDAEEFPACLENCHRSCQANNLASVHVTGITWGQFPPSIFKLPMAHFILGSDCFYDIKGSCLTLSLPKKLCYCATKCRTVFNSSMPHILYIHIFFWF